MTDTLYADITGNVVGQEMVRRRGERTYRAAGIEAGGRIVLGTATTVDVTVTDANGVVLYDGTVTSDTTVDPVPRWVDGPISVTTENISNSAHTLSVYWGIKE